MAKDFLTEAFLTLKDRWKAEDALQCRACEAPIALLRGEHRWQLFVKLYFKADVEAVTRRMLEIAEQAPDGVRGELEVNPVNMI